MKKLSNYVFKICKCLPIGYVIVFTLTKCCLIYLAVTFVK